MRAAHSRSQGGTRGCAAELIDSDEFAMERCVRRDDCGLEGHCSGQVGDRPGWARRTVPAHNDDLIGVNWSPIRLQRTAPVAARCTRSGYLDRAKIGLPQVDAVSARRRKVADHGIRIDVRHGCVDQEKVALHRVQLAENTCLHVHARPQTQPFTTSAFALHVVRVHSASERIGAEDHGGLEYVRHARPSIGTWRWLRWRWDSHRPIVSGGPNPLEGVGDVVDENRS